MDIYRLNFGIRSLTWNHENIFINGIPFYFRGFGRHEDSDVSAQNKYFKVRYYYKNNVNIKYRFLYNNVNIQVT